ncbi:GGDEF domain-containing protein [bacterium]|nr:GGDEF domain-containing protein [bacterium]
MTELLLQQANHDELTGLYNRRAFAAALQGHIETFSACREAHLVILDLDQFKVVNDTCGHGEGDRLLIEVSRVIAACVRSTDTVARLGGDEFAVLLVDCSQEIAVRKAEQIRSRLQQYEFYSSADIFKIGVSIGLVSMNENRTDPTELQQLADAACYAAKEAGRDRVAATLGCR